MSCEQLRIASGKCRNNDGGDLLVSSFRIGEKLRRNPLAPTKQQPGNFWPYTPFFVFAEKELARRGGMEAQMASLLSMCEMVDKFQEVKARIVTAPSLEDRITAHLQALQHASMQTLKFFRSQQAIFCIIGQGKFWRPACYLIVLFVKGNTR